VFDGAIAFTWPGLTNSGIAFTLVDPCVNVIDTPPSVVCKGNDKPGLDAGPIVPPKMEKMDPRAIDPPGNPGGMKLAAFTTPR